MKLLLDFYSAKKLTITWDGEEVATFVAMGFRQKEVALPDGEMGVELRYIVNSPERFEHVLACRPVSADDQHVVVEKIPNDSTINENVYVYSFEPLTIDAWRSMNVAGQDELLKEVKTDEELRNYYWSDWVPSYWVEDLVL